MKKFDWVKALGLLCTVGGIVISVVNNIVEDKKMDRYRETIDEYYAFKNEFPESKYLKEAEKIFNESQKVIKD